MRIKLQTVASSIAVLALGLNISGCTKCNKDAGTQPAAGTSATTDSAKPADAAPPAPAPASENGKLEFTDEVAGTGDEAVDGKKVTVHYTGTLQNGTKFDSSLDRNSPFTFTLGAGQVIQGWDQGVKGMKVGGKRKLTIPAHLGYGDRGVGGVIPPNSILLFEVELLKVE